MIRVLVVDDREESLYLLNTLLKGIGYEVESACNGAEALDKARRNPPQLIISDLLMPVMDGYTLLQQWRSDARLKPIPFVVYTATYTDPKDEQLALNLGADAFILKPAEPVDFVARLKQVLANPAVRRTAASPLSAAATPARIPIAAPEEEETRNLRQYSEVLIHKLEDKMEELDKANRELQHDIEERKRAEAAIRDAETRYRLLFEQSPDGIVILEPATARLLEFNETAHRQLGYSREEFARLSLSDFEAAETPEETRARIAKVSREGRNDFETRHRTRQGEIRNIHVTAQFTEMLGRPVYHCVWRDITESKQAEAHIRHLNRIYAVLSDINQTIVRERNPEAMFAATCRIAVEQGGFRMAWIGLLDASTGLVRPVASAGVTDSYLDHLNIPLGDAAHGHGPTSSVLRSGSHAVCNDIEHDPQMAPWRDEAMRRGYRASAAFPLTVEGQTIGTFNLYAGECGFFNEEELRLLDELAMDIAFALEVSRSEENRRRVEEAHTRLATAVEQATEIIMITDVEATILYVNPAFERVTGFTRQDAMGQNPRFLHSGKHDPAFYRQMWETLARGEVWKGHFINKKKNGTLYEEDATISPIRDAAGRIVNYVAVKRDATQQIVIETQLRQSQKMDAIGQLASGVAHDFNNILTVIHGNAALLLASGLDHADRSDCTQQIIRAAERAASLTRQLLLFSRKQVIQQTSLDLNEVVGGMIKMLKRILGEDISLCSELAPSLPLLYADASMIEQVLLNLAVNSRDAMPAGGRLTIMTGTQTLDAEQARQSPEAAAGSYAYLDVADTGCGIPPEVLPRIFEPFFTTKEAGKGTGLGLATVHGIVKQHDGWITVKSEKEKGTAFRIYLPTIKEGQAGKGIDTAMVPLPAGTETILLVEDETSLRLLMGNVLQRCGYTVIRAESGVAAYNLWKECNQPVHLLLADLVLPEGMSGFDLAGRLQAEKPQLKVIFTSGYSAKAGQGPPLIEGENFLQKPYSPQKLAQTVRRCLDQKASRA
jgi:PAS domain S-box-containing protein